MNNSNIFEIATRTKLRFTSTKGGLSVEQLWDVPLRSKDGFDLNAIAKATNMELKAVAEESFVDNARNPAQGRCELAMDIVKFVIETKLAEEQAAQKRLTNKAEKEKLLEVLERKQIDELGGLSAKEIQRRINALEV